MRAKLVLFSLLSATVVWAAKPLNITFIDVEGGQATLLVTPRGESVLIDTGWPGANGRDAQRISAAAKAAGIKKLDYVVITHHHTDHVGGAKQLTDKLPVGTFVDHGPNIETGKGAEEMNEIYGDALKTAKHLVVKPGDKLPLRDVQAEVVTANGETISAKGTPNANCGNLPTYPEDPSENARSVGIVFTYGKFRFADFGDLTARREVTLACPANLIGPIDLYLTTHHGLDQSNAKPLVEAIHPRVAIMNNGARKGGSPKAWQIVKNSPGLEDLWQLHYAVEGGKDNNVAEPFIANLDERTCTGSPIVVNAMADGSFTVLNKRNKYEKTYAAR